ncbi:hypothetical protein TPFB_0856a [Treponema pallidum str. Fribourg-Blanc]|nr:hypothetical protein TPFB_0856a [Treponema pallidum str. Fribourg-Blanc]
MRSLRACAPTLTADVADVTAVSRVQLNAGNARLCTHSHSHVSLVVDAEARTQAQEAEGIKHGAYAVSQILVQRLGVTSQGLHIHAGGGTKAKEEPAEGPVRKPCTQHGVCRVHRTFVFAVLTGAVTAFALLRAARTTVAAGLLLAATTLFTGTRAVLYLVRDLYGQSQVGGRKPDVQVGLLRGKGLGNVPHPLQTDVTGDRGVLQALRVAEPRLQVGSQGETPDTPGKVDDSNCPALLNGGRSRCAHGLRGGRKVKPGFGEKHTHRRAVSPVARLANVRERFGVKRAKASGMEESHLPVRHVRTSCRICLKETCIICQRGKRTVQRRIPPAGGRPHRPPPQFLHLPRRLGFCSGGRSHSGASQRQRAQERSAPIRKCMSDHGAHCNARARSWQAEHRRSPRKPRRTRGEKKGGAPGQPPLAITQRWRRALYLRPSRIEAPSDMLCGVPCCSSPVES